MKPNILKLSLQSEKKISYLDFTMLIELDLLASYIYNGQWHYISVFQVPTIHSLYKGTL